jgi:predicted transcriptional regulator
MDPAFELVAFVARSENRLATLRALSAAPRRRSAIQDATGIPRATLSRILADCGRRALVERSGPEYALTSLGERFVAGLDDLFEAVDRQRALQTLAGGLPTEELEVDLFTVDDLSVTLPNRIDPMAPVGRAAAVVESADVVHGFCYSLIHAPILAMTRDIVDSGARFVGVVSAEVLEVVVQDPELVGPVEDLVETGKAEIYVYDGGIETQFIIADDRVLFLVAEEDGSVQGLVETGEPAIRPWAVERFEAYRADAEPLDHDALSDLLTT